MNFCLAVVLDLLLLILDSNDSLELLCVYFQLHPCHNLDPDLDVVHPLHLLLQDDHMLDNVDNIVMS